MKSLILTTIAMVITLGTLSAQVKSTTIPSAKSIVEAGEITHTDSTLKPTDRYYTRPEVSTDSDYTTPFYGVWTERIGTGTFIDQIVSPLVNVGILSYVRIEATDDTTKTGIKSNTRVVIPKHKVEMPNIYSIIKNPTTNGIIEKIGYKLGFADSATVTHLLALDANYIYKSNTKNWLMKNDGFIYDTISGLKDSKKFYDKWIIVSYFGSKTIIDTFWTLPKAQKGWLRQPLDSTKITNSSIALFGGAISFGLTGTAWGTTTGGRISNISPLTGIGLENYVLLFSNLLEKTVYPIWVHIKNAKGEDSFFVGNLKTDEFITKAFTLYTSATLADYAHSKVQVYAKYNVPKGQTAQINYGIFAWEDSLCTNALQNFTTTVNQGSGEVYHEFSSVAVGKGWAYVWGTCSNGEYQLTPDPVKFEIWSTDVKEIKKSKISIYPNPAIDQITVISNDLLEFKLFDLSGKIVLQQLLTQQQTVIDVSMLQSGIYYTNTGQKVVKQ